MKTQATTLYPFVLVGKDFATALSFFAELGFDTLLAARRPCRAAVSAARIFMPAGHRRPEWQGNQMITFEWTTRRVLVQIEPKKPARPVRPVKTRPPTDFAWGARSTSSIRAVFAGT